MPYKTDKLHPKHMNIELTTICPLRCPQCYCSLTGGKSISLDKAVYWIKQGADMGVKEVELSGGETLCYPYIYDLIKAATKIGVTANIAISGYSFNQGVFDRLREAGVGGIFISLNGSTEEINKITRDGYHYAINALKLLMENDYKDTYINWVMHSNNSDDFPNVVQLAERYHVEYLIILGLKPDANGLLTTYPSYEQMVSIRDYIRKYKGTTKIRIETCYSPLLALVSETKLFGNLNNGLNKGCSAGLTTFNVNVDGLLSPCRHLDFFEDCKLLSEYWQNSEVLARLRKQDEEIPKGNCEKCHFSEHCRPCYASSKSIDKIVLGNQWCPISEKSMS